MKVLLRSFITVATTVALSASSADLERAMFLVYSQEFTAGTKAANALAEKAPRDPMASAVLASALLFGELDRLQLLKDGDRPSARPDAAVRQAMRRAVDETIRRAESSSERDSAEAWTALMMVYGVERDYLALVDKSYRQSWVHAKRAQEYALKLVARTDLPSSDAWFTLGFNEYLIANAPFVFRPFMKLDQADGDKRRAIRNLEKAATGGRYLRGFAQMILANAYRKEGRRADAERMLQTLAREYPQNGAVRKELSQPATF
jgi:tetratricopeptide (TPR) repeat protein